MDTEVFFYNLFATMIILGIASYYDIKKREVEDEIWLVYLILTFPFSLIEEGINLLFAFLPCFLFGLALFYLFKFGGADAKAIWCLSLALPSNPFSSFFIFPLSISFNAIVISLSYLFVNIFKNLKRVIKREKLFSTKINLYKKIFLFIFAQKMSKEEYKKNKFYIPIFKDGKIIMKFDDLDFNKREEKLEEYWCELVQPFLVYLLISVPFTLLFGDLILSFISFLIGNKLK